MAVWDNQSIGPIYRLNLI